MSVDATANNLANDILAMPDNAAIRFTYGNGSVSYPMDRFKAMARLWLLKSEIETFIAEAQCGFGHNALDHDDLLTKLKEVADEK